MNTIACRYNKKKFESDKNKFLQKIKSKLRDKKILIVYHNDCDGIISSVIVSCFLKSLNNTIGLLPVAQFRESECKVINGLIREKKYSHIFFLEGHNFSAEFIKLNSISFNIDHHPINNILKYQLNTLNYQFAFNPANAAFVYEIFYEYINKSGLEEWVALAIIMDYCQNASQKFLGEQKLNHVLIQKCRDIISSFQYNEYYSVLLVNMIVNKKLTLYGLVANKKFINRKKAFYKNLNLHLDKCLKNPYKSSKYYLICKLPISNFRIASPLANILSDRYKDKLIVVLETDKNNNQIRGSLRLKSNITNIDLGKTIQNICKNYKFADGTGHHNAGSFRSPINSSETIVSQLISRIFQQQLY